jgi:hypothetical protein
MKLAPINNTNRLSNTFFTEVSLRLDTAIIWGSSPGSQQGLAAHSLASSP